MRVIFRQGAIVAALAILAGGSLAGCGQRGPLYMPVVPPLPAKPNFETGPASVTPDAASSASAASAVVPASAPAGELPDTTGAPLSLTPDSQLGTTPSAPAVPQPASGATQPQ